MKHEELPGDAGMLAVRPALVAAAAAWDEQVEALRQAGAVLDEADVVPLGAWVAPVAALFLDGWAAYLLDLTRVVDEHAAGLRGSWSLAALVDGATADRLGARPTDRRGAPGGEG